MTWLFRIAELCFWLLAACILFQVLFVGMAYAVGQFTEPPACSVGYAYPLPFATCPGLRLGLQVDFVLALPGAVIALPFVLPQMLAAPGTEVQPYVLIPVVIYGLAALYAARRLFRGR